MFSETVVGRQTVVSSSLDIYGTQVATEPLHCQEKKPDIFFKIVAYGLVMLWFHPLLVPRQIASVDVQFFGQRLADVLIDLLHIIDKTYY